MHPISQAVFRSQAQPAIWMLNLDVLRLFDSLDPHPLLIYAYLFRICCIDEH